MGRSVVDEAAEALAAEARARAVGASAGAAPVRVEDAERILCLVRRLVFPGLFEAEAPADVSAHIRGLCEEFETAVAGAAAACCAWARERGLEDAPADPESAGREAAAALVAYLPELRRLMLLDAEAAFHGDPAARDPEETIVCYPGVLALLSHRAAHFLHERGLPLLPRVIAERTHARLGIDIHPGAQIGESFFIDHGTGVVIGETAVVGSRVKMYHGVTLGNKSFPKDEHGEFMRGHKRHPTIGDGVTIYADAVVLGGDTVVGEGSVISAGAIITESVAPHQLVLQPRANLVLRENTDGKWS